MLIVERERGNSGCCLPKAWKYRPPLVELLATGASANMCFRNALLSRFYARSVPVYAGINNASLFLNVRLIFGDSYFACAIGEKTRENTNANME